MTSISGFSGFDAAAGAALGLRARVADLTRQVASGQRADSYAGLGTDAFRAIDLRAELNRRETFTRAAERGDAVADAAQVVMKGISGAARGVLDRGFRLLTNGLPGSDAQTVAAMAQEARTALKAVVGMLGERYAGEAIFGGADPSGSPIIGPESIETTGLFVQIRLQVRSLGPGNGQAVLDATKALASSNNPAISPFTGFAARAAQGLETDTRAAVPVGASDTVEIGLFAYRNAQAESRGETTGSWARDLMRGLAIIANLGPDQVAQGDDYQTLAKGALASLRAGMDGLTEEQAALSGQQSRLAAASERNGDLATQLELQLGQVEEVDMAETITRLQATQTQLQASYRVLSMLGQLSLANFLR